MKICTRFFLILGYLLLNAPLMTKANNILKLNTKTDKGSEICSPSLTECLDIGNSTLYGYQEYSNDLLMTSEALITVRINQINPVSPFNFPWTIQAFDENGKKVGSSGLLNVTDFLTDPDNPNQRRATSTLDIDSRSLRLSLISNPSGCQENSCEDEYSTVNLTFKIYSGYMEVNSNCHSFNQNDLVLGSHNITEEMKTCGCLDTTSNQTYPINWGSSESSSQYAISNERKSSSISPSAEQKEFMGSLLNETILIYPNPAKNQFNLDYGVNSDSIISTQLFSMTGELIRNISNVFHDKVIQINTIGLKGGIYYVKIVTQAGIINRKLLLNQ